MNGWLDKVSNIIALSVGMNSLFYINTSTSPIGQKVRT